MVHFSRGLLLRRAGDRLESLHEVDEVLKFLDNRSLDLFAEANGRTKSEVDNFANWEVLKFTPDWMVNIEKVKEVVRDGHTGFSKEQAATIEKKLEELGADTIKFSKLEALVKGLPLEDFPDDLKNSFLLAAKHEAAEMTGDDLDEWPLEKVRTIEVLADDYERMVDLLWEQKRVARLAVQVQESALYDARQNFLTLFVPVMKVKGANGEVRRFKLVEGASYKESENVVDHVAYRRTHIRTTSRIAGWAGLVSPEDVRPHKRWLNVYEIDDSGNTLFFDDDVFSTTSIGKLHFSPKSFVQHLRID
jgi:hypothetical protein